MRIHHAWEDDHAEDALIPITAEIDAELKLFYTKKSSVRKLWSGAKKNAGRIAIEFGKGASRRALRRAIGEGYDNISSIIDESTSDSALPDDGVMGAGVEESFAEVDKIMDRYADSLLKDFE